MSGITCLVSSGAGGTGGGGGGLDVQTLTVGVVGAYEARKFGFQQSVMGGISDGTSNIYGGAAILALYSDEADLSLNLQINGVQANSGWTTMRVLGQTYRRVDASFSTAGGFTSWFWASSAVLGIAGATLTVSFD